MKARIKWVEKVTFLAESGSGHAVVLDGAPDAGGRNLGVRPMEMLLMGLGGCSAFDVVLILRKGREDVSDCVVELEAERLQQEALYDLANSMTLGAPQASITDAARANIAAYASALGRTFPAAPVELLLGAFRAHAETGAQGRHP